ncbi:MAG: hypothetical protein AAFO82_17285, partial [Bacteroidota bacterium]
VQCTTLPIFSTKYNHSDEQLITNCDDLIPYFKARNTWTIWCFEAVKGIISFPLLTYFTRHRRDPYNVAVYQNLTNARVLEHAVRTGHAARTEYAAQTDIDVTL